MVDDTFTDQTMPDSQAYLSNKIFGMKLATPKEHVTRKRVSDPTRERKYIYVGSKAWNERYLEYEWNGHKFGEKRQRHLPGYLNIVEKRREMRRNKAFERLDRKAVHAHEVQAHRELVDESDQYELSNEETRLRFTNQRYEMPAPVIVYADFESAIDDKNRHKPVMLFCLAVSRIPAIDTQLRVFHAPHESEEELRPFMDYLVQLHEIVRKRTSSMNCHWRAHRGSRRTFVQQLCVPSVARN